MFSAEIAGALLLSLSSVVAAHGAEHTESTGMEMAPSGFTVPQMDQDLYDIPSYAGLEAHSRTLMAHIVLMVLAWFFVLPFGVGFSIGRSQLALPVQLLFLVLNAIGLVVGTVYNISTPDLYEHNAHHSIGWIATWVMTAQTVMSVLFVYAGRSKQEPASVQEAAAFLPATLHRLNDNNENSWNEYRWSGDSGHGTEPPSPRESCADLPTDREHARFERVKPEADTESDDEEMEEQLDRPAKGRKCASAHHFLSTRVPTLVSTNVIRGMEFASEIIDRTILVLGFIALVTGGITYAGLFRGKHVFNGLAHFIKGGIFFWYGLLTLGRWLGCFADLGWAWNVKPTRAQVGQWKASLPSAEFTESFVIWLYGATNVFLEHLTAWGGDWSAQDLEHVSISIMFFGGGLCGMLVESTTIRKWLNTFVDDMPSRTDAHPSEAQEIRTQPRSYKFSVNMLPALIILLLGVMMSSHHQDSMVSTMVHKQWGTLLCGFSLARGLTYVIMWMSPPTSVYPSRPPTELVASFCLISGGLIFMASTKDIIYYMEKHNLMAMFVFTVAMGFTAFLMAYEVLVLAFKGWAKRRESVRDGRP